MIVDFSIIVMLEAAFHSWKGTLERFRFSSSEVGPFMLFPEELTYLNSLEFKKRELFKKRKLSPCKGRGHIQWLDYL